MSSYLPLLLQAREVEALAGLPLASLSAGKTHSAAVAASGEAYTWGDGSSGKLGHGTTGGTWRPGSRAGCTVWAGEHTVGALSCARSARSMLPSCRLSTRPWPGPWADPGPYTPPLPARLSHCPHPSPPNLQTTRSYHTAWKRLWGGCT